MLSEFYNIGMGRGARKLDKASANLGGSWPDSIFTHDLHDLEIIVPVWHLGYDTDPEDPDPLAMSVS